MTPPFHADHVGSLLRPERLKDAFRRHQGGEITDDDYRRVQDDAIREVVAAQESVGLASVTDGEFRRPSYWWHFVAAVDGLDVDTAQFDFRDDLGGRSSFTAPYASGRIQRHGPISGEELDFLATVATATPKVTLPSPSTMQFWHGPAAMAASPYDDLRELFADLGAVYREELADLAGRGATYVQLDEVALAMLCDPSIRTTVTARGEDPDELVDVYVDAINAAVADRPAGLTVTMHMCRGNYKGRWMASGGYEPVAERVFANAAVDGLFLEFDSERAGDFAPLRFVRGDTAVILGLVSSKTPELERREDVRRRIDEAAQLVDLDRLGLSPQCGFASTAGGNPVTEADQWAKLELVVDVAGAVWT